MQCQYGGEITFTVCEQGYRLRLYAETTVFVLLSPEDARQLQQYIQEVIALEEKEPPQ